MTTDQAWKPRDPAEAFFPVEMRPHFISTSDGLGRYQQLKCHFAVVDVEQRHPFAVVTDDYELVTNEAAYDVAAEVMKKVFHMTQIGDMACLNKHPEFSFDRYLADYRQTEEVIESL